VVSDDDLYERLRETRRLTGAVAAPDTAWLLLRGLATLDARVNRQTETARALAARLARHAGVTTTRYPGFGGLISFDVADEAAAHRVETATRVIQNATSLGSTHSKIEARRRWEGERCPPGLLRFSVGLEDVDELWRDLEQALAGTTA
jgi:cystathionine gamma-synthase